METSSIFKENSIQLQEYFTYETWSIKRKKKKDISTNWFETSRKKIQSNREYREQKTKSKEMFYTSLNAYESRLRGSRIEDGKEWKLVYIIVLHGILTSFSRESHF